MKDIHPTKQCIRHALIDLLQEIDIEKIGAKKLAEAANISRATFYHYYGSVDEVLNEIEEDFFERMRDNSRYYISSEMNASNLHEPNRSVIAIADFFLKNKKTYLSLTGPHGDQRFSVRLHKFIREFYLGKLAYEGVNRKDIDMYVEFVLAGSDGVIRYWLEKRTDMASKDVAPIIQNILYGPFLK